MSWLLLVVLAGTVAVWRLIGGAQDREAWLDGALALGAGSTIVAFFLSGSDTLASPTNALAVIQSMLGDYNPQDTAGSGASTPRSRSRRPTPPLESGPVPATTSHRGAGRVSQGRWAKTFGGDR